MLAEQCRGLYRSFKNNSKIGYVCLWELEAANPFSVHSGGKKSLLERQIQYLVKANNVFRAEYDEDIHTVKLVKSRCNTERDENDSTCGTNSNRSCKRIRAQAPSTAARDEGRGGCSRQGSLNNSQIPLCSDFLYSHLIRYINFISLVKPFFSTYLDHP